MSHPPTVHGYVVARGAGLQGPIPGVKAGRASTGGSLSVIETTIEGGPPRHMHTREDESFYVLDGRLVVECGGERFDAAAGAFVFLPRNVPHAFRTVGGPATALVIATPGGLDEYFADLRAARDPTERAAVLAAYGIVRC
jgi:mannose-6-phosphate isomerase-like protein (cupin superfamily)